MKEKITDEMVGLHDLTIGDSYAIAALKRAAVNRKG